MPIDEDKGQEDGDGKVRASDLRAQLGTAVDEQALMRLLEKQSELLSDNHRLRGQRTTLKGQVAELQGKVPAEGTRVLSAEEGKAYDAYVALGVPSAIKLAMDANGEATQRLAKYEREKLLTKAAEAVGFKPSVLLTLAGDLDIQTKEKDGKPIAVVVMDGKEKPLDEYATQTWGDFLPALRQQEQRQSYDINASNRGGGPPSKEELVNAEAQRLMKEGRYGGF